MPMVQCPIRCFKELTQNCVSLKIIVQNDYNKFSINLDQLQITRRWILQGLGIGLATGSEGSCHGAVVQKQHSEWRTRKEFTPLSGDRKSINCPTVLIAVTLVSE